MRLAFLVAESGLFVSRLQSPWRNAAFRYGARPMTLLRLFILAIFILSGGAFAREQSDAPDVAVIGFSPDGRYFAYEQYGFDLASEATDAAIFVIDRNTNAPAEGFPFGFISVTRGDEYPARFGDHDIDLDTFRDENGIPDLEALRQAVRTKAQGKLDALKIGTPGRRVAGIPLTQRGPIATTQAPLSFILRPTIPSAIPDQQYEYTLDAKLGPMPEDCANVMPPARQQELTFKVWAARIWPERKVEAEKDYPFAFEMEKETCPAGFWISDLYAVPGGGPDAVVAVFLFAAWSSAVDSAHYHALYITLPGAP